MLARILILIVAVVAGLTIWHGWSIHRAMRLMQEAPQGQGIGPENAAVTVTEFIDYRCHVCREMHPVMSDFIKAHPDVRVVYRHLPMAQEPSVYEARLAIAAAMQGKFAPVHERLMSRDTPVEPQDVQAMIEDFGIDTKKLGADMESKEVWDALRLTNDSALRLGGVPLPSFIIDGRFYRLQARPPTLDELEAAVAAARAEKE